MIDFCKKIFYFCVIILIFLSSVAAGYYSSKAIRARQKQNSLRDLLTIENSIVFPIPSQQPLPSPMIIEPTQEASASVMIATKTVEEIITPTPDILGSQEVQEPEKTISYTIALLGDSMIQTLGEGLPSLKSELNLVYPSVDFTLLNYGLGSTNIDYGLKRLSDDYVYNDQTIIGLIKTHPDLVVVESFAYNNFGNTSKSLKQYALYLEEIANLIHEKLPASKLLFFATIAPNSTIFADGVENLNLTLEEKKEKTATIQMYLQEFIKFARDEQIPLADAYTLSLDENGEGKTMYINPDDHIHYSQKGDVFVSKVIRKAIEDNQFILP